MRHLALCLALLAGGCAASYKATAAGARSLDAFAVGVDASDARMTGAARSAEYLKVRNDLAGSVAAAALLLPAGCSSDLSKAGAAALAALPAAAAQLAAFAPADSPIGQTLMARYKVHRSIKKGQLDPQVEAALVSGAFAAAPALFQGLAALLSGIGDTAAQAQADCAQAVAQAQADALALPARLRARDAALAKP